MQALIEALPAAEEITADNMEDVVAQLDAIDAAKAQLSEEDIAAIDFAKYDAAAAAVLALIGEPQGEPAPTALSEVYVTLQTVMMQIRVTAQKMRLKQ